MTCRTCKVSKDLVLALFWRRSALWVLCTLQHPFSSLESCCNTNAFELNPCIHDCLPPQKSLVSDPVSRGDAFFITSESHEEHLGCLFLANCPVVFVRVYRLPCPKMDFSYVIIHRIQIPK